MYIGKENIKAHLTSVRLSKVASTTIHSLNPTVHIWAKRNSASKRLCSIFISNCNKQE